MREQHQHSEQATLQQERHAGEGGDALALGPVGVEEVRVTEEDEYFPPPRELRELLTAVDVAATALLAGPLDGRPTLLDRAVPASDVLAALV